jgi:hypothetical protein
MVQGAQAGVEVGEVVEEVEEKSKVNGVASTGIYAIRRLVFAPHGT